MYGVNQRQRVPERCGRGSAGETALGRSLSAAASADSAPEVVFPTGARVLNSQFRAVGQFPIGVSYRLNQKFRLRWLYRGQMRSSPTVGMRYRSAWNSTTQDLSRVLIELGLIVLSLAILARIASRWGFSAIPSLPAGWPRLGKGGLAPLNLSAGFTTSAPKSACFCFSSC